MDANRDALGGVCTILNSRMVSVPSVADFCRRRPPALELFETADEKVLKKLFGVVVYATEEFVWQEGCMFAWTSFQWYFELKWPTDTT